MKRLTAGILVSMLTLACAHHGRTDARRPDADADRLTAARIYMVAEERFAAGAYDEATALMRHAILQLAPAPEHDHLRHQLILRMGHTQLRDHAATGDRAPLRDAQQMLLRYLERHQALFDDGDDAQAERGEVVELLDEIERELEATELDSMPSQIATSGITLPPAAQGPPPAPVDDDTSELADDPSPDDASPDDASPDDASPDDISSDEQTTRDEGDDGEVRTIVVQRRRGFTSIEDPVVLARLATNFSTGWGGLVLTRPGIEPLHGPRPLLRGSAALVGAGDRHRKQRARRLGGALLEQARPDLLACHQSAFSREPIAAVESAVEAEVDPGGTVSHVRIEGSGLVDGLGDACVIEALDGTTLPTADLAPEPLRIRLTLRFFYQSAVVIVEGTGETAPEGGVILRPNPKAWDAMPSIEHFVR